MSHRPEEGKHLEQIDFFFFTKQCQSVFWATAHINDPKLQHGNECGICDSVELDLVASEIGQKNN